MKVELAKAKDIDFICNIIYDRCLWFSKNGLKGWNVKYYPKKYNKEYFKEQMNINKLFVAKENNKIYGVMLLKKEDKDYWSDDKSCYYIRHLATDINMSGVGKLLLNYAKSQCKKDNKEFLRLDCYKTSVFLNNYYKSLGFVNVGSGKLGDYSYNLWEMKIM